ncbi:MAG TPA: DUF6624 domain-containing protein [Chitinophagaceae bacterium]|nr:DUF6624 domain-containing protein [Chitinophagaceae bacterium]
MRQFIALMFLLISANSFCQSKHELDSLTHVLEKISVDDQKYRSGWDTAIQKYGMNSPEIIEMIRQMNLQDSINMSLVAGILDKYGWLSKEQTSADANDALFLVIQHATLPAQLKYLPLLKKAVADKKAKAADYALLVDRTNMYQGKFQIYGSQINYDEKGHIHIFPILDEPHVNKRRKEVGLPSMQEYLKLFDQNFSYHLPETDRYKNKIVIKGSVNDNDRNQPLANVAIYTTDGRLSGVSDSGGFYQILIDRKNRSQSIIFKKNNYDSFAFKLEDTTKQVIEINPVLIKKQKDYPRQKNFQLQGRTAVQQELENACSPGNANINSIL